MPIRFTMFSRRAAGAATAILLSASIAAAQSSAWTPAQGNADGGTPSADAARRALVTTNCTTPIQTRFRTENSSLQTNSTSFNTVPGAVLSVTVPAGTTRCVKVAFTGEAGCAGASGADFCYVRATANGAVMNPNGGGEQVFSSEDSTAEAHAYQWISRLGPGTYNIAVQGRVASSATTFFLDDWTFEVETLR